MTDDDFKDAPVSVAELRADKAGDGRLWTPRDALVNLLREIDRGEVAPDTLVIAFRDQGLTRFRMACHDGATAVGVLELAKHYMLREVPK